MSESLIIQGKQYISSRRAAEIAGYSNDYVGQLCRSGKLVCQMVGRFWYVDERSVLRHLEESAKIKRDAFKKSQLSALIINPPPPTSGDTISRFFGKRLLSLSAISLVALVILSVAIVPAMFSRHLPLPAVGSTASTYDAILAAGDVVHSVWENIYSGITSVIHIGRSSTEVVQTVQTVQTVQPVQAVEPSLASVISSGEVGSVKAEHIGLVILSPQGSSTDQTKLEKSIQNSFSDPVVVDPNPDGTTGVIRPVFRTVSGHDYLYVLVPVKASTFTPGGSQ